MWGMKSRNLLIAKFYKLSFVHSYYRNHGTPINNTNHFFLFLYVSAFLLFFRSFIDRFPINVILIFSVQSLVSAKHFFVQSSKCVRLCVNDFIVKGLWIHQSWQSKTIHERIKKSSFKRYTNQPCILILSVIQIAN